MKRNFRNFGRKAQGGWAQFIPLAAAAISAIAANQQNKSAAAGGTTTTDRSPWGPSAPYLQSSMQQAQQFGGSPLPYGSPGEMVAPLNPWQTSASGLTGQGIDQSQRMLGTTMESMQPFLRGDYMNVNSNPYLQASIGAATRPITEAYTEGVLPNIRGQFSGAEGTDHSRQGIAEGIASRGYLNSVADTSARMSSQGYTTGLQATQNAMGQVPGMINATMTPAQSAWGMGSLLQGQAQQETNAKQAYDQLMWQRIMGPAGLYSTAGGQGGMTSTNSPYPQTNPLSAGVGGALAGSQIYDIWSRNQTPQQTPTYNTPSGTAWWGQTGQP